MDDLAIAAKRVSQLEIQNKRFRTLLKSTMEVINKNKSVATDLIAEAINLNEAVEILEREKSHLENELHDIFEMDGQFPEIEEKIQGLENENLELRARLSAVISKTKKEISQIKAFNDKNAVVNKMLVNLENERKKLIDELNSLHQEQDKEPDKQFSQESLKLHLKILELDEQKARLQKDIRSMGSSDSSQNVYEPPRVKLENLIELRRQVLKDLGVAKGKIIPPKQEIAGLEHRLADLNNQIREMSQEQEKTSQNSLIPQTSPSTIPVKPTDIKVLTTETYVIENDGNAYSEMPNTTAPHHSNMDVVFNPNDMQNTLLDTMPNPETLPNTYFGVPTNSNMQNLGLINPQNSQTIPNPQTTINIQNLSHSFPSPPTINTTDSVNSTDINSKIAQFEFKFKKNMNNLVIEQNNSNLSNAVESLDSTAGANAAINLEQEGGINIPAKVIHEKEKEESKTEINTTNAPVEDNMNHD